MKQLLLFFGLLLCVLYAAAQPLPVIEKDGQKYYQYTLQEGQTLLDLQALTKSDIDQLLLLNPGLERGLEAAQTIIFAVQRGTLQHKIAPQQTLFALSRMYDVSVDSLLVWNPQSAAGLKVGQVVRIHNAVLPFDLTQQQRNQQNPKHTFSHKLTDTIIQHTVSDKETLYSISKRYMVDVETLLALNKLSSSRVSSGQQLLVPIQKEKPKGVPISVIAPAQNTATATEFAFPVPQKAHYNIAVFLPFQLDSSSTNNQFVADAALDYYMGMKMALDSLKKLGFSADIHVFDDNAINPSLDKQLADPQMKRMDLIFSPLQEKQAKTVATFAKANGIPVVFPVQMSAGLLQMSPNFMAYTTPDRALMHALAMQIHQLYQGRTVVLIGSPIAADQILEQHFKKAFASVSTTQSKLKLQEATASTFQKFTTFGGPRLLVSFSSERAKVMDLLKIAASDTNTRIAGHKDWLDYKELDAPELRNQAFLVALPSYFSYHAPQMIPFHKLYRKRYNTDLSKMACLGFDLTLHIGRQLVGTAKIQKGLISNMNLMMAPNGLYIENGAGVVVVYKNAQLPDPNHE